MKTPKITYLSAVIAAIAAIVIFCIIAVLFNIMSLDALPVNFIGATLGALIGALITLVLLRGQTDIEEKKGKDIRILEKKTEVFQDYIKEVWKVWEDQKISIKEFQTLTSKYYQNLMIYLDKENLKYIGEQLSNLGACIGKEAYSDYEKLREAIINIINRLSKDIDLGGQVDTGMINEHDKIVFPLLFRNMILDALNKKLSSGTNSIFHEGRFENFREGPWDLEYICFYFKKHNGCKIIIGPFVDNHDTKLGLVVDRKYTQVNDFRSNGAWFQRIEIGNIVLNNIVEKDGKRDDSGKAPSLNFSDHDSMENYRKNKRNFSSILAERVGYHLDKIIIDNMPITDFLEKYIGES
jgi:hypothetical protein